MSFTMRSSGLQLSSVIAICCLLLPATARVIWVPAEFDPSENAAIVARDASTISCGASFPSDFTCPQSTTCLPLNTTSSIQAVICCPAGQDCSAIQPVDCTESIQNATLAPNSQLHADPTTPLQTCGSACCPMGYSCKNNQCYAQTAAAAAAAAAAGSSSTPLSSTTSTSPTASSSSLAVSTSTSSEITPAPTGVASNPLGGPNAASSRKFSGASFAAGLIPGIFLGAFLAACLLFVLFRKGRRSSTYYIDEKQHSPRDTLTDLGTLSRRPTMHGRSISEPTADPYAGHRTDFLRGTPPRIPDGMTANHGYAVEATGPVTPARTPKVAKALFSRSPFLNQSPSTPPSTQPPLPGHLKRGTLSFTISPVRALKKQKSMHSLRRQMTDASRGSSRRARPDASRSGSTETIQVLMPSHEQPFTPDQRPFRPIAEHPPATLDSSTYQPHESASTWRTTDSCASPPQHPAPAQYASSSRYPTQTVTPTQLPRRSSTAGGQLGTPYTPSRYYGNGSGKGRVTDVLVGDEGGLRVVRQAEKRDTTFSAMMERAGFRKSELIMGSLHR